MGHGVLWRGQGSQGASSARNQVEDQNYDCDDDQEVNQGATDVESEAEQPQNEENYEDCPKHF
jgi:hypothetical protein